MRTILNSFSLIFLFSTILCAQENDFQIWSSISASKKLIKKTGLYFKQGIRFRDNSSIKSRLFTDLRIKRKFNKHLSYAVGYRYLTDWGKQMDLNQRNRFYADVYYRDKYKKRFLVSSRIRCQTQGNIKGYSSFLRHKSLFAYNIRKTKFEPSIALEYFFSLKDNLIEKIRYTLGFFHPIANKIDLEIACRVQKQYYINNPETLFIFDGKLSYDL